MNQQNQNQQIPTNQPQQTQADQYQYRTPLVNPLDNYEKQGSDLIQHYGSIIKDLTDTETLLYKFELRLLGKGIDEQGNIIKLREPMMDEEKVRDFVDQVKSIVNQNTHFTRFNDKKMDAILQNAGSHIPRWMMQQGSAVPQKNRGAINFMALNLIIESLHKANEGTILRWSKGGFTDSSTHAPMNERQKGALEKILFWRK